MISSNLKDIAKACTSLRQSPRSCMTPASNLGSTWQRQPWKACGTALHVHQKPIMWSIAHCLFFLLQAQQVSAGLGLGFRVKPSPSCC